MVLRPSVGAGIPAAVLLAVFLACPPPASAGWTFTDARHSPMAPDHETNTTFFATVGFVNSTAGVNGSAGNGTGQNGTMTNGTGTNGTGTNGTGRDGSGTNETGTNGTGTNGTGTNGTGTNGTGTNGAGTNGTGTNGTGTNATGQNGTGQPPEGNVTSCFLVIEPRDNRSAKPLARLGMYRRGPSNDFTLTLGPWPPGTELAYHFEANLSNGTQVRSNTSWVRTPDLLAIPWHNDFEEALRVSRELRRPMMVLVYSGLAPTTQYVDENLSRPSIVALSAGLVCCRVNDDLSPAFRLAYEDPGAQNHSRKRWSLPVLVFINGTTEKALARLDYPFDVSLVEKEMRFILGKGPDPAPPADYGPDYRLPAAVMGAVLALGPVAMYIQLRRAKKREKG
jgi:hypothetical protein